MKELIILALSLIGICILYTIASAIDRHKNPNARQSTTFKVMQEDSGRALASSKGNSAADAFQQTFSKLEKKAINSVKIQTIEKYVSAMEEAVSGMASRYPNYDLSEYRSRCCEQRCRLDSLIAKKMGQNIHTSPDFSDSSIGCCHTSNSDLYSNHDESIEDRWNRKARKYLESIESDLTLLLGGELSATGIIDAPKIKNHILSQYDSYWKWTEKCAGDCESQTVQSRLWDSAREDMKFKLSSDSFDVGISTWWGVPSNKSVREQLEKRLNDRITELRPEYLRKKKLMEAMVSAVAAEETMLRADLMKLPFDSESKSEISSVYRVLVRTGRLLEMKAGSRYIVSLSDKERSKKDKQQRKPDAVIANANPRIQEGTNLVGECADSGITQDVPLHPPPDPVMNVNDLRESPEALKETADDLLTSFFGNYFSVVLTDHSFSDAEKLPSLVPQCLQYYDAYLQLNLYDRCGVEPFAYMKVFIGNRYEPCMDSREELEKHLIGFLSQLEPVRKRKEKLDSEIIRYLSEKGEAPRSDVLEHQFGNCTLNEVAYCYGSLKQRGHILEFSAGDAAFARLSGKEETGEKSTSVSGSESSKLAANSFSIAELTAFLNSNHMEYADKTPSGGCFWILAGTNTDSFIQSLVVDGAKPVYAKDAKALNHRPGWFIKPAKATEIVESKAKYQ